MLVEVYGKSWCVYCDKSKELLTEKGQKFTYHDVEKSPDKLSEMKSRAPGAKTVPQIFVDNSLIGGYDNLRAFYKNRS